jgi:hypothetical protein
MTEVWQPIPGQPDYEASSLGRIRSKDKSITFRNRWGTETTYLKPGRVLAGYRRPGKYITLALGTGTSKGKTVSVHALVASAFHPQPTPAHTWVNHIDGDKHNNAASNLEWTTPRENHLHRVHELGKHNLGKWQRGVYCPPAAPA